VLILTGQRRNEVAEMRWQKIDFEKRLWTLPKWRCKNDVEHVVPLSTAAITILNGLPKVASSGGFVFTTNGESPISGFARAKDRLGAALLDMPAWTLHDIRRTFASGMARLGVNLPVIEKLLNHVSGSFAGVVGVHQRHSFADEKRAAMDTWARHA